MARIHLSPYVRRLEEFEVEGFIELARKYEINCYKVIASSVGVSAREGDYEMLARLVLEHPNYAGQKGVEWAQGLFAFLEKCHRHSTLYRALNQDPEYVRLQESAAEARESVWKHAEDFWIRHGEH